MWAVINYVGSSQCRLHTHRPRSALRSISQLVQVPLIFGGLLIALWSWKSLTLIVFQNKIIYMPYLGRYEELKDHRTPLVEWHRRYLKTSDSVTLALCNARMSQPFGESQVQGQSKAAHAIVPRKRIRMVYLQGNASSTPPRLPHLSKFLLQSRKVLADTSIDLWTVSYRGYWQSTGRPSEVGLLQDVKDSLTHIIKISSHAENIARAQKKNEEPFHEEIILWGHSIGASLAIQSLHHIFTDLARTDDSTMKVKVILETPFDSIQNVLLALYPEPWLPYRYLSPFLRTRMDMKYALMHLHSDPRFLPWLRRLQVLVVVAGKDEIVPLSLSQSVVSLLEHNQVESVVTRVVRGGLHQDCLMKSEMHKFVMEFIEGK